MGPSTKKPRGRRARSVPVAPDNPKPNVFEHPQVLERLKLIEDGSAKAERLIAALFEGKSSLFIMHDDFLDRLNRAIAENPMDAHTLFYLARAAGFRFLEDPSVLKRFELEAPKTLAKRKRTQRTAAKDRRYAEWRALVQVETQANGLSRTEAIEKVAKDKHKTVRTIERALAK